jgi:Tol biopolymer transport system component
VTNLALGSDAFHLTASEPGDGWVELASTSSRVVRFPLRQLPFTSDRVVVEAEDAEQPVVSRDGKWLAFIREARGHARLWVKELLPNAKTTSAGAAGWQAGDDEYGVLEAAFFPDDRIVFAAETGRSTALFALDPNTRRIAPLPVSSRPTRYPAVSPDGQWLAYSQDEMGSWRLWVMRFSTGEKRRLTIGDCNSIAPAWFGDSKTLVYDTDCGRAVGLTALCRVQAVP